MDIPAKNPTGILQDYGILSKKSRIPIRKFRNPGNLPGSTGFSRNLNAGFCCCFLPIFLTFTENHSFNFQVFSWNLLKATSIGKNCMLKILIAKNWSVYISAIRVVAFKFFPGKFVLFFCQKGKKIRNFRTIFWHFFSFAESQLKISVFFLPNLVGKKYSRICRASCLIFYLALIIYCIISYYLIICRFNNNVFFLFFIIWCIDIDAVAENVQLFLKIRYLYEKMHERFNKKFILFLLNKTNLFFK